MAMLRVLRATTARYHHHLLLRGAGASACGCGNASFPVLQRQGALPLPSTLVAGVRALRAGVPLSKKSSDSVDEERVPPSQAAKDSAEQCKQKGKDLSQGKQQDVQERTGMQPHASITPQQPSWREEQERGEGGVRQRQQQQQHMGGRHAPHGPFDHSLKQEGYVQQYMERRTHDELRRLRVALTRESEERLDAEEHKNKQIKKLREQRAELERELDQLRERHRKEVAWLRVEADDFKKQHRRDIDEVKERHERMVKDLRKELERKEERHERMVKAVRKELEEKDKMIAKLQQEVGTLKTNVKRMRKQHSSAMKKMRRQHASAMKKMRRQHTSEIQGMRAEIAQQIKQAEVVRQARIEAAQLVSLFLDKVAQQVSSRFHFWTDLHKAKRDYDLAGRQAEAQNLLDNAKAVAEQNGLTKNQWERLLKYKKWRSNQQDPDMTWEEAVACIRNLPDDEEILDILPRFFRVLKLPRE